MTISGWERGLLPPSAKQYIQLGNLAGKSDCWFYWRLAGLHSTDLMRVLPHANAKPQGSASPTIEIVAAGTGGKIKKNRLVAIPLLKVRASAHEGTGDDLADLDESPAEEMLAAPALWCPNPAYTKCLLVEGDSMMPLIRHGDIVAVDASQHDVSDLDGKVVIAWHEDKGSSISRLRKYADVLVLDPENREHKSVVLGSRNHGWRVVAKVLWWIGKAP